MAVHLRSVHDACMQKILRLRTGVVAGLAVGTVLSLLSTGCVSESRGYGRSSGRHESVQAQVVVTYQDDYDYYPDYEIYYSRNRREYVYRDGGSWIRRSQPQGITLDVLLATPSVRVDFHDEPEHHHDRVVKTYPRNWRPPGQAVKEDKSRRNDEKRDKKADDKRNKKKDKDENRQN
jgi:hypothetical protein